MENTKYSKLDELVVNFADELEKTEALSLDQIEEAEDYIYSEAETLRKGSLSIEEAFMVAKMRYGNPLEVANEYGKVNTKNTFIQLISNTLIGLSLIKLVLIFSTIITLSVFNFVQVEDVQVMTFISLPIQLTIALLFFYVCSRERVLTYLKRLDTWYLPVLFLSTFIIDRMIHFFFTGFSTNYLEISVIQFVSSFSSAIFCIVAVLYFLINRKKNSKMKLV